MGYFFSRSSEIMKKPFYEHTVSIEVQCNTGGLLVVGKHCMKPMGPVELQRPHSFLVAVSYMELNTCTFFYIHNSLYNTR